MNKKDFGYNTDCCCLTDREINQVLMKENQALKDRWEKLKEWIDKSGCFLDDGSLSGDVVISIYAILDKMEELEDRH